MPSQGTKQLVQYPCNESVEIYYIIVPRLVPLTEYIQTSSVLSIDKGEYFEILCNDHFFIFLSKLGHRQLMVRSRLSQTRHDRQVQIEANRYTRSSFKVWADIKGWPQPGTIDGYRPDVIAYKNGSYTVIEVETTDSVNSSRDVVQQRAFKTWASRKTSRHYKRIVV